MRGWPAPSQESLHGCQRAGYNQVQPEASWQREEDSKPNKDMEFDIKVEIKIHGHHPCSEQKEGPRSLTAKHNRFPSALPERFQKTQQIHPEQLHTSQAKHARSPLAALAGSAHTQCRLWVCGLGNQACHGGSRPAKPALLLEHSSERVRLVPQHR